MGKETTYTNWLREDYGTLIESLNLNETQKHIFRSRWIDQVVWMEGKATRARTRHYTLRLTSIVGGVIVPALVGINLQGSISDILRWVIFSLSLVVAITSATEEFFHYGERWRHYRGLVEMLKSEGWQFFQLSGAYSQLETHAEAYEKFTSRIEDILRQDVQVYLSKIVGEKEVSRASEAQASSKLAVK